MSLSLVPQIFYDLIARVMPGALLFITGFVTFVGPRETVRIIVDTSSKQELFTFWTFLAISILSYFLSLLLSEIDSILWEKIRGKKTKAKTKQCLNKCITEYNSLRKLFGEPALELKNDDFPSIYFMHDNLRPYSASETYRLLKLRAEQHLCEILFTGYFFLSIINIWYWSRTSTLFLMDRALLEIVLIVAMYSFWKTGDKLERFFILGTFREWLFFNFPVGVMKNNPQKS